MCAPVRVRTMPCAPGGRTGYVREVMVRAPVDPGARTTSSLRRTSAPPARVGAHHPARTALHANFL
ncbi:hypothetical protein [Streptomyces sp. NBC_00046]|uniref:hypothetical protein n=1 Tax=unclassified Streptomyces TaxID=2593676 RepID=UPI003251A0F0